MAIVNGIALESNKNFRIDFEGGNLSSDAGLLLVKEFYHKLGVESLAKEVFHTTDPGHFRFHKDHENLMQMLYQITAAYYQDDHADALRHDPVFTAALGKSSLASQPTLSRFHNRMDASSLAQLQEMHRILRRRAYSVSCLTWIPRCFRLMGYRKAKPSTITIRLTAITQFSALTG